MLCSVVLVSAIHQHESATGPLPHEPPSHLPPHHTPLVCHRALGGAPCITQHILMATYFTHGHVFVSMLHSQFVPPSPFPVEAACSVGSDMGRCW